MPDTPPTIDTPPGSAPMHAAGIRGRPASPPSHSCPDKRASRDRLRAMAADLVASWRAEGIPPGSRSPAGLRRHAELMLDRVSGGPEWLGWTMVAIVSEYSRDRLAAGASGRRLLLVPDCPVATARGAAPAGMPLTCGPGCTIGTIWQAARENGWVVEPTTAALGGIGALLTGQYDGVLGVAKLGHLEKAFAMLPAFALPIAAVPFDADRASAVAAASGSCADASSAGALDVDWVLGLLGVAGGAATPMGDYLPLLREAAGLFTPDALHAMERYVGLDAGFGDGVTGLPATLAAPRPLEATGLLAAEFLCRGGKFLRPFITLAAFDAVVADRSDRGQPTPALDRRTVHAAAAAIEIFHKASLVHDDIEDDDAMRYGRPTMHVERGIPLAINAGDHLLGLGYGLVARLPGVSADAQRDLVALLADAHVRLARGQGGELWWRGVTDKRLRPDEALELYGLKTSPAFEAALTMGVRMAGADPAAVGDLRGYALHVGTGFQVLNDLKDWRGDADNARIAAGDLLGGRPTVLWALAVERLGDELVARMVDRARSTAATGRESALGVLRDALASAGVFDAAAAIVDAERNAALAAGAACPLPRLREVLDFLLDLAVPERAAFG
ncbi:MAG: polyprenyl synthetase family protein [Planctomycetaceae bacterium]